MSLLNLQADEVEQQTIEDFLDKGQNRVKSMALIHEQLYRSDNVADINMGEYLEELVGSIFNTYNRPNIAYQVKSNETHLDIDKAVPIGLIVNELVNNSLKHAFKNKTSGNIDIQMIETDSSIEVTVKDDGTGFEQRESQVAMGLQLVSILVQQLRGTFKMHQKHGTEVRILFPAFVPV